MKVTVPVFGLGSLLSESESGQAWVTSGTFLTWLIGI